MLSLLTSREWRGDPFLMRTWSNSTKGFGNCRRPCCVPGLIVLFGRKPMMMKTCSDDRGLPREIKKRAETYNFGEFSYRWDASDRGRLNNSHSDER